MSELLTAALRYAARGWPVVPLHTPQSDGSCSCGQAECTHVGKHPRVKGWQRCASTDPDMIAHWWRLWPRANIGIVTGQRAGLLVLDVDEGGEDTLAAGGGVPDTLTVATGHGSHRYFQHPGVALPNAIKFLPGLDIRTDGGLVVAPPSRHASGRPYQWLISPEDVEGAARLPPWLCRAIQAADAPTCATLAPRPYPAQGGATSYAVTVLDREVATITATTHGGRNHQLNRSAFAVGTLVGGGYLPEDAATVALVDAGMGAGLSAREARQTVASGLRAGIGQPRTIAPPQRPPSGGGAVPPPLPPAPRPPTPPAGDVDDHHRTDLGNAERFIRQHGPQLRYVPKWGCWLVWDGTRWVKDETNTVYRQARTTVRSMYHAASAIEDSATRKELVKWALASESKSRLEAMIALAESEEGIPVRADELDADTHRLNCMNGIIDLRTGQLGPHDPAALITKRVNVAYHPQAQCPTWLRFLDRVLNHDQELITYVQRAIGYTLTGSTQEQCLFFAYGTGRNGKSTFFEVLLKLMAEYAQKAQTELIMMRRENAASNDVARLAGARLVVTAEIEEGRRLSESLVKDLTGGDTLAARFLYQELFEFTPTHKLWLYGNHKPEIKGTDPGIWRRIRVIPFEVQIPAEEVDPNLRTKLLDELPGILAWAVRGCLDHQRHGLPIPSAVQAATAAYRSEMDVLAAFMADCCVIQPKAQTKASDLYRAYVQWCEDNGERALTQRRLGQQLNERGFELKRVGSSRQWYRFGIGLLDEDRHPSYDEPEEETKADLTDVTDLISEKSPMREKSEKSFRKSHLTSVRSAPPGEGEEEEREAPPPLPDVHGAEREAPPLPPRPSHLARHMTTAQWAEAVMAWRAVNTARIKRMARRLHIDAGQLIKAIQEREKAQ